ncbi:MAG: YabP/YqfC family sporulation protein [Clostridia bacterium]|nr:YabP/YqfC family sporulation protein [Clostridia bacterium]
MSIRDRAPRPGRARFPRPPKRERRSLPALEWAEDAVGRCARATAIGSRSLLVENHTGIRAFASDCVELNTREGPLRVCGGGLTLRDARPGAVVVHGRILRVELPCEGGRGPDEG